MITTELGSLVHIQTGKLDANAASNDGQYPFFTCAREPLRIGTWSYDLDAVLVAGNGDLNVKHYKGKFDAYQRTYVLSACDSKKLDSRYLYYFMDTYLERLREQSIGGIIKYIKLGMLKDARIPLPPLDEQKRIAAILDQADTLRRLRQRALDRLNTLGQSIFYEMFGDPLSNPKGFEVATIESTVGDVRRDIRCGPFGTQLKVAEIVDKGVPLLGIENVLADSFSTSCSKFLTDEKAKELSAFDARSGDVLITRMGTIGRTCVVPENFPGGRFSYHLFRIRVDKRKCLPEFLASTVAKSGTFQAQLKQMAHGAIMQGLSISILRKVRFQLPPIEKQHEFVTQLTKAKRQITAQLLSLKKFETLFSSLQQRALRGEL